MADFESLEAQITQPVPEIRARSLADARRDLPRLTERDAVVSIGSPETPPPEGLQTDNPRHLRLQFDDVVDPEPRLPGRRAQPPGTDHIARLLERSPLLLDCPTVYCHCAAGVSRSTAAAFILRCIRTRPGREAGAMHAVLEDNPFASPNRLMIELADQLLDRDGRMIEAAETVVRAF